MGKHRLVAHPGYPPSRARSVEVEVRAGERVMLTYAVAPAASLVLPGHDSIRADGLWRSTCFELFLKRPGEAIYREFNFAPRAAWNAYAFTGWRHGMRPLDVVERPQLRERRDALPASYALEVMLPRALLGEPPAKVSLTTILKETDGTMSYWALAHPPGEPDFHQAACFEALLPPIAGA